MTPDRAAAPANDAQAPGPHTGLPPVVLVVTGLAFEAAIARRCAGVEVLFGVGPAAADALHARLRAAARAPAGIVSFGTAGALDALYAPGQCLLARAVLETTVEPAEAAAPPGRAAPGESARRDVSRPPRDGARATPRHACDGHWLRRLAIALPGAACVDFAATVTPVVSATQKHLLHARTGAAAVDMESAALARVAAAHGLPFVVCRVVVDRASHTLPPAALAGMHTDGSTRVLPVLASLLRRPAQLPSLLRLANDARLARRAMAELTRRLPPGFGFDFTTRADRSS